MIKKLFSHTAIYGLAPQIPKIAGVFVLPIITPYLSKLDFGVFGVITAVVGAISVFSTLGLNVVLGNMFYKSPNYYKWGWRQIYGFLTLWNIPYSFLLGLLVYFFIPKEAKGHTWSIILLNTLPVVLFGATSLMGTTYYRYLQKPMHIAMRSIVIGFITVIFNLLFIAHYKMGYIGWFLSGALGQVLLQFSYWFPLYFKLNLRPIFNFKWKFIKQNLKVALPTVPHYYGGYLMNSSDRMVMNMVGVTIGNVGLYNAANTISNPFLLVGTAAGQAVSPMLLETYKNKNETITRQLIFTLQIIFLAATFLTSIWIKEVFALLIKNPGLQSAYPLAIIIIMAYSYRPMYLGANNRLFYHEKTKVLLKVTFIAGISNLALNFIFIPIWGYGVAAYTTFAGLMYMGYIGYFLKEFKEDNRTNYYPFFWLTLTILLTGAAVFLAETGLLLRSIMTALVLIVSLMGLYKLNKGK